MERADEEQNLTGKSIVRQLLPRDRSRCVAEAIASKLAKRADEADRIPEPWNNAPAKFGGHGSIQL